MSDKLNVSREWLLAHRAWRIRQIADELCCTGHQVVQLFQKQKVKRWRNKTGALIVPHSYLERKLQQPERLAIEFNCSLQTISKLFQKHGLKPGRRSQRRQLPTCPCGQVAECKARLSSWRPVLCELEPDAPDL